MARGFLKNPGFELGDRDWTKSNISIDNDAANARSGVWVVSTNTPGFSLMRQVVGSIRPGLKVNASVWSKHTADFDVTTQIVVEWLDKDGVEISQVSGNLVSAGTTTYTESTLVDVIAPERAKQVRITPAGNNSTAGTAWFDDVDASGDIIEALPGSAKIASSRIITGRTLGSFKPLVGNTKFQDFNGGKSDKWAGTYTFVPQIPDGNLGELLSFLSRIGKVDRFFAFDPDRKTPKNGVVNGMVVDGAGQAGFEIAVRGGPAETTALVGGDYVEVREQYYQLQRDLEIGPEGTGVMQVWPAIRTSPADGEDVITDNPAMMARVTSDLEWPSDSRNVTEVSISWEEAA